MKQGVSWDRAGPSQSVSLVIYSYAVYSSEQAIQWYVVMRYSECECDINICQEPPATVTRKY